MSRLEQIQLKIAKLSPDFSFAELGVSDCIYLSYQLKHFVSPPFSILSPLIALGSGFWFELIVDIPVSTLASLKTKQQRILYFINLAVLEQKRLE